MSVVETHDLACLIVQAEGRAAQDSLLYALYVLHRVHLAWVVAAREAEADQDWATAIRLHVA